jgi:SH3-like domain-containing protein
MRRTISNFFIFSLLGSVIVAALQGRSLADIILLIILLPFLLAGSLMNFVRDGAPYGGTPPIPEAPPISPLITNSIGAGTGIAIVNANSKKINLRSTPSSQEKTNIIRELDTSSRVNLLGMDLAGEWAEVEVEVDSVIHHGWIYRKFLSSSYRIVKADGYDAANIHYNAANIRDEPRTDSNIKGIVRNGGIVEIINSECSQNWCKVRVKYGEGELVGWINMNMIQ